MSDNIELTASYNGRKQSRVRFSVAATNSSEVTYVLQAIKGGHLHGDGPYTERCSKLLEALLECPRVLLTPSCTHALELAVMLLDLKAGEEVIMPSFTFPSTATAVVRAGGRPVFVDIRTDTLNMDEEQVEAAITQRTRAIMPVHYAGVGCEMSLLMTLAHRYGIEIIEDNAQGLFGRYKGKMLGTFGSLGCLSFHSTKNITCGEGGALLVNDSSLVDRAEAIREKGTNRRAFLQGKVEKYTWVDVGSSFLPSDILAAFLLAQLESWPVVQERRRKLWEFYLDALMPLSQLGVKLPEVPSTCEQSYHLFYILTRDSDERSALMEHARLRDVECAFHYQPLHTSQAGRKFATSVNGCQNTIDVAGRLVRLPLHMRMSADDQTRVIDTVLGFYGANAMPDQRCFG